MAKTHYFTMEEVVDMMTLLGIIETNWPKIIKSNTNSKTLAVRCQNIKSGEFIRVVQE